MVNEVIGSLRCRALAGDASPALVQRDDPLASERVEPKPDAVFVDATLGTAGHTLAILEAHPTCRVVAFDRDAESMEFARERLAAQGLATRATLLQGDFRQAGQLLQPYFEKHKVGADGRPITRIDGALVDAGMSLYQVTWAERGLSFRADAPLDMRYDRSQEMSAFDLVNRLSTSDLEDLLFKYADERWARRIAASIAAYRRSHVIRTTGELVSLIEAAIPSGVRRHSRVHPATKTFAALRLAVNDEFWALEEGAWALSSVLANAARLVILTYSSNEDRTVKRTFRRLAGRPLNDDVRPPHRKRKSGPVSPGRQDSRTGRSPLTFSLALPFRDEGAPDPAAIPACAQGFGDAWRMRMVTPKPLVPTDEEIARNPLARSCKLRAMEKLCL